MGPVAVEVGSPGVAGMWARIVAANTSTVPPWWAIAGAIISGLAGIVIGYILRAAEYRRATSPAGLSALVPSGG